jgi:lipopolysaccharide export system protein LptA
VRKYALILFLLLIVSVAFGQKKSKQATSGQKKSRVELVNSENATGVSKTLLKVLKGTFKQDFSTLTSDSANFYMVDNKVDALGHVIINQGDTLHIYADKLNYDGNTKIAILTDNVKLVDKDAVLTTNHLTYNTATKIATYTEGGKLVNKDNTLLSKVGYYFSSSRDAYFRYDVSLKTPDALVITDTMRYNTGSRISYFYPQLQHKKRKGQRHALY